MLHTETLNPNTLDLLKTLSNDPALKDYLLVGGTALALEIGHRISIDLDFFCYSEFEAFEIAQTMAKKYGYRESTYSDNMTIGSIGNVKVDFVKARNILTKEPLEENGIRLADKADIAAMKLWAIARSGTRMKDYVDIACLSKYMCLDDMLESYCKAYNTNSDLFVSKKLLYFKSIESMEPINMLNGRFDWNIVKERLQDMVSNPTRVFESFPLKPISQEKHQTLKGLLTCKKKPKGPHF